MRRIPVALITLLGFVLLVTVGLQQLRGRDVVSREYDSYQAAQAGNFFADGWLPRAIPASAKEIVTINDLDRNSSRGEFRYDPSDTASFVTKLQPRRDTRSLPEDFKARLPAMEATGYRPYEYKQSGAVWLFLVNRKDGHVLYDMGTE